MEEAEKGSELLTQLEFILHSDPLVDELGIVHPSQIAQLHGGVSSDKGEGLEPDTGKVCDLGDITDAMTFCEQMSFWCADHKLAISASAVPHLYKAAKVAFFSSQYQSSECADNEDCRKKVMMYSRVLVLINGDFKTAWNSRKKILSSEKNESALLAELRLSSVTLSYNPKSEEAWAHRRWVINQISKLCILEGDMDNVLLDDLRLVELVAEKSRMNYRAWQHCCWLVQFLSCKQVVTELQKWTKWAESHVADNCCFHFRRCIFLHLLKLSDSGYPYNQSKMGCSRDLKEGLEPLCELVTIWKGEFKWVASLIKRYEGREALWTHRRFLFSFGIQHFSEPSFLPHRNSLLEEEMDAVDELAQKDAPPIIITEDNHKQDLLAATYICWALLVWRKHKLPDPARYQAYKRYSSEIEELVRGVYPQYDNLWENLLKQILLLGP